MKYFNKFVDKHMGIEDLKWCRDRSLRILVKVCSKRDYHYGKSGIYHKVMRKFWNWLRKEFFSSFLYYDNKWTVRTYVYENLKTIEDLIL